jgi:hypothetical protein
MWAKDSVTILGREEGFISKTQNKFSREIKDYDKLCLVPQYFGVQILFWIFPKFDNRLSTFYNSICVWLQFYFYYFFISLVAFWFFFCFSCGFCLVVCLFGYWCWTMVLVYAEHSLHLRVTDPVPEISLSLLHIYLWWPNSSLIFLWNIKGVYHWEIRRQYNYTLYCVQIGNRCQLSHHQLKFIYWK